VCNLLARSWLLTNCLTLNGSTSHEWSQSCVSRNIQIELPVAHHTEIFEGACVEELCAIKEKGRQCNCQIGGDLGRSLAPIFML